MASLRRVPGSRYWIACFTDKGGKRRQKSTKETDRKKAQRIADGYEKVSRTRMATAQVQRVIAGLYQEVTGNEMPSAITREYFERWLDRREPEVASSTNTIYRARARDLLESLGPKADRDLNEITKQDILNFRTAELDRVSAKTTNHGIRFLRMVFKSAREDGLVLDNPTEFVRPVKLPNESKRRAFTMDELNAVLREADPEWQSLIYFGLYSAQRIGDLAKATHRNLDLVAKEFHIVTTKTGRPQNLPILDPLLKHIMSLPAGDDPDQPIHPRAYAIVANEGGRVSTLSRQFYDLMASAGLVPRRTHKKRKRQDGADGEEIDGRRLRKRMSEISFHSLRHTATTMMKNAGQSPAIVEEFVGHDSAEMNRVYTHIEIEAMRRAGNASLPDLVQR